MLLCTKTIIFWFEIHELKPNWKHGNISYINSNWCSSSLPSIWYPLNPARRQWFTLDFVKGKNGRARESWRWIHEQLLFTRCVAGFWQPPKYPPQQTLTSRIGLSWLLWKYTGKASNYTAQVLPVLKLHVRKYPPTFASDCLFYATYIYS